MKHFGSDMNTTPEEQKVFKELFAPALANLFRLMGYEFSFSIEGRRLSVEAKQLNAP